MTFFTLLSFKDFVFSEYAYTENSNFVPELLLLAFNTLYIQCVCVCGGGGVSAMSIAYYLHFFHWLVIIYK